MPILRKYTATLESPLSTEQFAEFGKQLGALNQQHATESARQASIKKELAGKLAGIEAKQAEIFEQLARGTELRDVEVEVIADYEAGVVREIRLDTGELVKPERPLRDDERQIGLALPETPTAIGEEFSPVEAVPTEPTTEQIASEVAV